MSLTHDLLFHNMYHTGGSLHAVVDNGAALCLSKDFALKLDSTSSSEEEDDQPLRLHQFVCTAFRSELNVAENGAGKSLCQSKGLIYCVV